MINIDDEILNRFLDDDLNQSEKDIVRNAIAGSVEIKKRYEALLEAHNLLKSAAEDSPSLQFTTLVMNKLNSKTSIAKQQKYFLISVLSFLGLIILAITGYAIFQIISTVQITDSKEIVINYSKPLGDYLSGLFNKNSLSIIGSVLSFIMIITGYSLFEYQRHSKKKFIH